MKRMDVKGTSSVDCLPGSHAVYEEGGFGATPVHTDVSAHAASQNAPEAGDLAKRGDGLSPFPVPVHFRVNHIAYHVSKS